MITVEELILQGLSICEGIGIGKLYFLRPVTEEILNKDIAEGHIEEEVFRYRQALNKAKQDIRGLQLQLRNEAIPEGAAILASHIQILKDPLFSKDIEKKIRAYHKNAEYVLQQILEQYMNQFHSLSDPYFRERGRDIEDIGRRIMGHLTHSQRISLADIPPGSIVYVKDLTPSLVAEANQNRVGALVSESGGVTSHAAIVAKAKGIPYLCSISSEAVQELDNSKVIVDACTGIMILYPERKTILKYRRYQKEIHLQGHDLNKIGSLEAETFDGYPIGLAANIDVDSELEMLHQYGGKGVGLYRSEYVFLNQPNFPTEEEQYYIYRRLIEEMKGLPIVVRTFDVGGDKHLQNQQVQKSSNPFLGCRAIRFLLKEKAIFRSQIRAILRAAYKSNVSMMFPMVSALSELREAKDFVAEVQRELKSEKIPHSQKIKIGCMIEVPSAALIADLLAPECDFLSIGTNDLVQYSLAVDRSDQSLSDFYAPTHPGIIRLIQMTVTAARRFGIPVCVCGEIAADPRFVPLLLGLGVQELSVATRFLPLIKLAIRQTSMVRAVQLAEEALKLSTAQEIESLLVDELAKSQMSNP